MLRCRGLGLLLLFLSIFCAIGRIDTAMGVGAAANIGILEKKQKELDKQQASLSRQIDGIRGNITKKREHVDALRNEIKLIQEQIDVENARVMALNEQIEQEKRNIEKIESQKAEELKIFGQRISAIYKVGDTAFIDMVLGAQNMEEFIDIASLIEQFSKSANVSIGRLNEIINRLNEKTCIVNESCEKVLEAKRSLDHKRKMLGELKEANQSSIDGLKISEKTLTSKMSGVLNQKQRLEREIERFHESYTANQGKCNKYTKGRYRWPIPGFNRITSHWGDKRGHKGIDVSGSGVYGANIVAVADGVVIKANSSNRWGSGWGYSVMIDHGDGCATQSAHCSKVFVSPGDHVKSGQVIAQVGSTGDCHGAHLHFETWKNGKRYNPMQELNK